MVAQSNSDEPRRTDFDSKEYHSLRQAAIEDVSNRFFETYPELIRSFGERGFEATREDVGFTLDFLRPALEFGQQKSFVEYLVWLSGVLSTRGVPEALIVKMLDWLAEFFESRLPNERGKFVSGVLQSSKSELLSSSASTPEIYKLMPEAWPEYMELEQALLMGNLHAAKELINAHIKSGKSILDVELHLIQPALYQVGIDWQQNKVTVAQEHLATSTALTLMAQEFTQVRTGESSGKKVLCACVEGNEHAVGLRIVADAFELNGWEVEFLGANLPAKELVRRASELLPDLICLSLSMPEHLRAAKSAIAELHRVLGDQTPGIMLGGLAVNAFTSIADELGADASATDARRAVQTKI
jgi:methanogenic corrinoid protein MtbC1